MGAAVIPYYRGGDWSSEKLSDLPKARPGVSREPRPVGSVAHVPNHQATGSGNHSQDTHDELVLSCRLHGLSGAHAFYQPGDVEEFWL